MRHANLKNFTTSYQNVELFNKSFKLFLYLLILCQFMNLLIRNKILIFNLPLLGRSPFY